MLSKFKQRINAIKIQAGAEPSVIPVSTAQQPAGRGSQAVRTTLPPAAQPSKLSTTAITSAPTQALQPSTILTKPKKSNMFNKPEHLRRIHSKPIPCAVDLRFRKLQPDSGDYNTFFDDPDPRDAADVERRQNEPYADQLRKEYAAQKQREEDNKPLEPDFTKRKEPAKLPPSRPVNQEEPTKRRDEIDNSRRQSPGLPSGLNTQDLMDRNIRKPSAGNDRYYDKEYPNINMDGTLGDPKQLNDFYPRDQRDTMTVDDDGRKLIDEELLKDRIKNNMGSIKDFFKQRAGGKPFEGFCDADENRPKVMDRQPPTQDQASRPGTSHFGYIPDDQLRQNTMYSNDEMVKRISDNFANMLNDIVTNTRAAQASKEPISSPGQSRFGVPPAYPGTQPSNLYDTKQSQNPSAIPDKSQAKSSTNQFNDPRFQTLDDFYSKQDSVRAARQSSPPSMLYPSHPLPKDLQTLHLDKYLAQLSSLPSPVPGLRESNTSGLSEGEVRRGFQGREYDYGDGLGQGGVDGDGQDKSEGEVSEISNKIFFE